MSSSRDRLTILLVTYNYPPRELSASRRPAGFAKYLRRLGHRVIVLTSHAWTSGTSDGEPMPDVYRTRDLMGSSLNWRRGNLRAYESAGPYRAEPSLLTRLVVPDIVTLTWIPFALPAALRLARRVPIDCVLTTSGPESAHLVGAALHRRGIPWVADLRDGWRFEPYRNWSTRAQIGLDGWLERRVLSRADSVTTVSEPITEDLRTRLGLRATTVHNGFDPEESTNGAQASGLLDNGQYSFVHTGRMWTGGRSPTPLLEALRLLRRDEPRLAARIEVVLAGPMTHEEHRLIEDSGLGGSIRHVGVLDHAGALGLQREADALLLLTAGSRTGEATGKLFEYLNAERPILVLGDGTEAARIVEDTSSGAVVPADDPVRIATALEAIARGDSNGFDPAAAEQARAAFAYPALAERMAEILTEATERGKPGLG